ncbi:uncharacterized protein B0H18DRAFT_1084567 [Fomitopsis serialis]|uniref:uncharacterized protein n=1 Tax=Fomitopsis serialis TaxID=139415 RepID=UPI002007A9C8|nr:uncharacterized protein B0H18DRAFT_1084567 [Neoantrodia serialis]KAH9928076.1 hypothetical protein B0H18DRAFT_1084567 [Neoantrodia serialis]
MGDSSPAVIHQLPYDILLHISSLLPATDIAHLLSTCQALRPLSYDEYIWKKLSNRVGVHDLTGFGGRSFRDVYIGLLHTYSPLLGLWAGDHPFTGQILEFRLDLGGQGRSPGIVGEVWIFRSLEPEEFDDPIAIQHPTRVPVLWIGFLDRSLGDESGEAQKDAAASCFVVNGQTSAHPAHLTIMSETKESIYLHTRYGQHQHPTFPHPAWHEPVVRFPEAQHDPSRYYPLRSQENLCAGAAGVSPMGPSRLAGLWLGSYGAHGTECLFLTYDDTLKSLHENVPRGSISWDRDLWSRAIGDIVPAYTYRGLGTVSGRGYMPHQRVHFDVILAVVGPDELRLLWIDDGDIFGLIRYHDNAVTQSEIKET